MHLTFWSVAAPILFWGGLYFVPLSRPLKIVIAIFVLALGWSGYASAQALPSPVFTPTVSGNAVTFSGGTAAAANSSSLTFGHAANGAVFVESAASFRTAGGSVVPVVARSAPSALAIAKTIGSGLALASNVGMVLVAGVALYEFAKEMGFKVDDSSGALVVTKPDPSVCSSAPCLGYIGKDGKTYSSAAASCANEMGGSGGNLPFLYAFNDICYFGLNNIATTGHAVSQVTVPPQPPAFTPSTVQQLQDAIASKSGWPASSKIDDALRDAVKSGAPLPLPKPSQITGPLEVSYPPTTVTNPDGSKTVTTKKEAITYVPDGAIKVDTRTDVQTLDPAGNPTGTTTITESPTAPKPDPITCGLPGTPACAIDEAGTPKESPLTEAKIQEGTDAVKAAHKNLTDTIVGDADKGWSWTFLGAPPVAQCEPVQFPAVMGVTPPVMNPCGTVDGMRAIMGWIWAFVGFYMCIGYVREVI